MDILGASAINNTMALFGRVADLAKKGATIELQEAIQTLRESVLAQKEENLALREELTEFKRAQLVKDHMVFEDPVYYKLDGASRNGPFCQACFDKDKRQVRLLKKEEGSWKCAVCSNYFQTQEHRKRSSSIGFPSSGNDFSVY